MNDSLNFSDDNIMLVTGGAGFIGSNIVKLLVDYGHKVRVLDNLSTGYLKNIEKFDVDFIKGDICDNDIVQKAISGVSVVFHLAAHIGNVKSLSNPQEDAHINIIGTLNILEASRKLSVKRIIYSSSAAIFGELLTMPIGEDHPQNPDSPYGVSKLAGEKSVLCFGKLYDIVVVCLRYFNVYGQNQRYDEYGNVIPIFANRLISGKSLTIYGDGEQTRDFVNVKDVAMANYLAAAKAEKSDVYNVGSGQNITINQLAQYIQLASGISTSIEYAPPRKGEVRHCRADISKITNKFGFRPDCDIQKGPKEYFEWFREDFQPTPR
jgi:nucleoside-diphosphate-sugar epimerase